MRSTPSPAWPAAGLTLDTWPVGTGPYMMTEYVAGPAPRDEAQPELPRRAVSVRGHARRQGGGPARRLRQDRCRSSTRIVFDHREARRAAAARKFRQGYLRRAEVFERTDYGHRTTWSTMQDSEEVRAEYQDKGFKLPADRRRRTAGIIGFNMLDPVIGKGDTPEQQANATASCARRSRSPSTGRSTRKIFPKKAGETAMGPLPPGIFGSRHGTPEGVNPVTHKVVDGKTCAARIDEAKKLLVEAGYPNGRDAQDRQAAGAQLRLLRACRRPSARPEIDWMVEQFAKIDIQLEVRATDNNQFQDKVRKGKHQIFWLGWLADYPDAENFLFLLYGPERQDACPTARTPRTTRTPSTTSCSRS